MAPTPRGSATITSTPAPSPFPSGQTTSSPLHRRIAAQATTRDGELFFKQLAVANPSLSSLKITGVKNLVGPGGEDAVTEVTRTAFVPATPEVFSHDLDGNLAGDARWSYTWDGENRLIAMETAAAAVTAGVAKQKLEFGYDGQGRRFSKKVYSWNGIAWVLGTSTRCLYDGWAGLRGHALPFTLTP